MKRDRRLPLQLKLTAALVLIVITPLAASAYLIDQLGKAAANVAAGMVSSPIPALEKAKTNYRNMVELTKHLHNEIADRLAQRPDFLALDPTINLAKLIGDEPGLRAIAHNGGESARSIKHTIALTQALGVEVLRLPSTSPANASWTFERKLAAWRAAFEAHGVA